MDPSYPFNGPAGLLMVGVVENQTYVTGLMVGTHVYAVPQLDRYVPQGLSPVNRRILHKAVEDILACVDEGDQRTVLLVAPRVPYAEAW